MIRFTKKETGNIGEDYAVKYLKKHGCKILEQSLYSAVRSSGFQKTAEDNNDFIGVSH